MAKTQPGGDPESVILQVTLPAHVAKDLVALAELYHATPERMVASWTQTYVEDLVAGLAASRAVPETPDSSRPRRPR